MSEEPFQSSEEVSEGAPLWVVTFGDLMSLLLCFFVLLLSFSETDRNKYKEVAGSMANAFGIQRKIKTFDSPKGMKIIARDFDQDIFPPKEKFEFVVTQDERQIGEELIKEIKSGFENMKDLIQVNVGKKQITIRLMGETAFDSGKAEIKGQMIPLLEKIGAVLKGSRGDIIVAGHTDNVPIKRGTYKTNMELSTARSSKVALFLIHRSSVDPKRIATMGFGEYRPIESNDTPKGREKNRRVEIILTFLPSKK